MKPHVLIVDDDEMILAMVSFLAKERGSVRTTQVGTGAAMHAVFSKEEVDLLVLDLGLPDEDGLALVRQIRARSGIPIIILTGNQTKESLIAALELGVNDFLTKPFDPYELQLRINNQLRFARRGLEYRHNEEDKPIRFEGYVLDPSKRSLETESGKRIHLTNTELTILAVLAKRPDKAMSRGAILDAIAMGDHVPSDRAVDVYIAQIRRKIEKNPKEPKLITAVRGYGYVFSADVS
jgi:DNA-binding response OmpR family regulator